MKKADNFNPGKWLIENKLTNQSKINELLTDPRPVPEDIKKFISDEINNLYDSARENGNKMELFINEKNVEDKNKAAFEKTKKYMPKKERVIFKDKEFGKVELTFAINKRDINDESTIAVSWEEPEF